MVLNIYDFKIGIVFVKDFFLGIISFWVKVINRIFIYILGYREKRINIINNYFYVFGLVVYVFFFKVFYIDGVKICYFLFKHCFSLWLFWVKDIENKIVYNDYFEFFFVFESRG